MIFPFFMSGEELRQQTCTSRDFHKVQVGEKERGTQEKLALAYEGRPMKSVSARWLIGRILVCG